jgi:hypothetical protein
MLLLSSRHRRLRTLTISLLCIYLGWEVSRPPGIEMPYLLASGVGVQHRLETAYEDGFDSCPSVHIYYEILHR